MNLEEQDDEGNDPRHRPLPIVPASQLVTVQELANKALATITPQQARVGEVSEALIGAYGKASTLELTEAEVEGLLAPFEDSQVEIRPHDGLIYIPHIHISNRLNRVFRPGQWALVCRRHWLEGATLYAEYVLLVKGCFVGESVGGHQYQPNNPKTNYSDSLESTAAEALRRICGKRLGCGSQVWEPAYSRGWVAKYAQQVHGKWSANVPSANPSLSAVSSKASAVPAPKTPPSAKPAPAKASPKPPEKTLTAVLNGFQERCKKRLVEKAHSDMALLPYWQRYCVQKGWILDNEPVDAILGNVTEVFKLDRAKGIESNSVAVQDQFSAHELAVLHMAQEATAAAHDAVEAPRQDEEIEGQKPIDDKCTFVGPEAGKNLSCPNCGDISVVFQKQLDGILYCQGCAWQWDVESGDYFEEHDWMKVVYPKTKRDEPAITLGQISRKDPKRWYGIVLNNQEAKAWVGSDGKERQPSKRDKEFAKACQEAVLHMEQQKTRAEEDMPGIDDTDQPF